MSETIPKEKSLGRPSKFTPETRTRLVELIAKGLPFKFACHAAGVSFQSFSTYREAHDDFREEIESAVAVAVEKRLKIIERAADAGDVNSAKWLLEHLHPMFFARSRIELTGADGASLTGAVAVYLPKKDSGENAASTVTVNTVKEVEGER
jgi:hypothetical protein